MVIIIDQPQSTQDGIRSRGANLPACEKGFIITYIFLIYFFSGIIQHCNITTTT